MSDLLYLLQLVTKTIIGIGSFARNIKEIKEMVSFYREKGFSPMIEVVKMDFANRAFKVQKDVKY